MINNKYIKVLVSAFLLLMALWVATPKVYIHELLHHDHSEQGIGQETKIKSQGADDCDFEKYNKPTYFSIFKFVFSFIPIKPENNEETTLVASPLTSLEQVVSLLRGPPTND